MATFDELMAANRQFARPSIVAICRCRQAESSPS